MFDSKFKQIAKEKIELYRELRHKTNENFKSVGRDLSRITILEGMREEYAVAMQLNYMAMSVNPDFIEYSDTTEGAITVLEEYIKEPSTGKFVFQGKSL